MTPTLVRQPARIALPLVAWAAMATYGRYAATPGAGAEISYLALLAAMVLLTIGALAVRPGLETGLSGLLVVTAVWALPAGAERGVAVGLILALALAAAAGRRFLRDGGRLSWESAVAAALGAQFLFQAERLLIPLGGRGAGAAAGGVAAAVGAGSVTSAATGWAALGLPLVVLPILAALAAVVLAERVATLPALLAAGTVLVLGRGWTVAGTIALLALAAIEWARAGGDPRRRLVPLGLVLAVAVAVDPTLGILISLVAAGRVLAVTPWGAAGLALAATGLAVLGSSHRDWPGALEHLAWIAILLPAVILCVPGRWRHLLIGVGVAVAASRLMAGPEALAAAVAYLALAIPVGGGEARGAGGSMNAAVSASAGEPDGTGGSKGIGVLGAPASALAVQSVWTGGLVLGGAVVAGFPWLRAVPAETLLARLGLTPGWAAALGIVAGLVLLGPALGRWVRPAVAVLVVVFLAAWLALPAPGRLVGVRTMLTVDAPEVTFEVDPPAPAASLVADSGLSYGTLLATGTEVLEVRLVGADGRAIERRLRAGVETGEWAAHRPDVALTPGLETPPAWLSWVTPESRFFGQRYRAVQELDAPIEVSRVELRLLPTLPPEVALDVVRLELRP